MPLYYSESSGIAPSTVVNSDVAATASIAYSKLSLTDSIVDGDVASTASVSLSKLSVGAATASQVMSVVSGNWAARTITSSATTTSETMSLASNVDMLLADTYYNGPSVSLTAGTWIVTGKVLLARLGGITDATAKLYDGGTTVYDSSAMEDATAMGAVSLPVSAVIAPSATFTVWVAAAAGNTSTTMSAAATSNTAGNTACTLSAMKVA